MQATDHSLPVLPNEHGERHISPTDIAQFIRLEQCERYLRLRLHERAAGNRFMREYDVTPQALPQLLASAGQSFEQEIEQAIAARYPTIHCAAAANDDGKRDDDNALVLAAVRDLAVGSVLLLLQPRLAVALQGWRLRGDIDILRLERNAEGALQVLIADTKSSTSAKVEHRLQVAFYAEMLSTLFAQAGVAYDTLAMAVLYRDAADDSGLTPAAAARRAQERQAAQQLLGCTMALIDITNDADQYRAAVADLVTGPASTALRVATADFAALPFHLSHKCDGCLYNEFCMKWSAEHDDLSLLPHLSLQDKAALQRAGLHTTRDLALLKEFRADDGLDLVAAPGRAALLRQLGTTWPIGQRLDELVQRARRYRAWQGDALRSLSFIPSKGYGSLPYSGPAHNPNLIRVYIDAQHDYLHDRIYLIGALVVACVDGVEDAQRQRSIVHLSAEPPATAEQEAQLLLAWISETIQAIVTLAAPDAQGEATAPIHLIFFDSSEQRMLLQALSRHFGTVLGATPLYDFFTQMAAFDSPIATFLDQEIRELKNYPLLCQSLQALAAYRRFDWDQPQPYSRIFRARLFDSWGKLEHADGTSAWYTSRARFSSQIPLEYAYAAWNDLPASGQPDDFAAYRAATPELLCGFQARRLEALAWIAQDFPGNRQTQKSSFRLPDLASFSEKSRTLAQSLAEFIAIERYVELNAWKTARLAPPERRVLGGLTLTVVYDPADQDASVAQQNRENEQRRQLKERYYADYRAANPGTKQVRLSKEQKAACDWKQEGLRLRLRIDLSDVECDLAEALALTTLRPGDRLILAPRTTVDSRLPPAEQQPFTPTPKQLLYGMRADLQHIHVETDGQGRATAAWAEITLQSGWGGPWSRGFVFPTIDERPLIEGQRYTLDADPNNIYGYWCLKTVEEIQQGASNTLYARLSDVPALQTSLLPPSEGQERFLAGLDALHVLGALHAFEPEQRAYIASHGETPVLLVQGPPGTGKSYATAFALFARLQGAMAAGRTFRVFVACKTHAATDVLLKNIAEVQGLLRRLQASHSALWAEYFAAELLDVPLFRLRPRDPSPAGVRALPPDTQRPPDAPKAVDAILAAPYAIVAATPGGIYKLLDDHFKNLAGHDLCDCLVLDEASQMNLPEALMAALPLAPTGLLIVVGDHRQMPPIVKHDWGNEPRRSFQEYRAYESLFQTLLQRDPPLIRFAESFRLHADMADFLRREIYAQDGIAYFSRRRQLLPQHTHADAFIASVLAPEQTMVVIVHDEAASQARNPFEQELIAPLLETLADPMRYGLDPIVGLGVVVPHRAQRAGLQERVPQLLRRDPVTGALELSAVDTIERFQGSERTVILVSATESDREYLRSAGEFLLDPRRLTVALSRAKCKLILVAARSVFTLFTTDEETFANAQLWKNLLRRTCTKRLWSGTRAGIGVEVWGNRS